LPVAEAVRRREPVFVHSLQERLARFPSIAKTTSYGAWAALPLEGNQGILGAIGLSFPPEHRFDKVTRERLRRLAWQCAQALDRALLFDSEQKARREAEAASHAKDEFLAMLGHELRNPLSPILTSLHLMELRLPNELGKERAVIKRQVQHMVRLVDDLLDVSRITNGRVELRKRRLELATVVGAALEVVSPLIEQRKHQVEVHVPEQGLAVEADPDRLSQVVSNLLTNAAKYTEPAGRLEVSAQLLAGQVELRVRDWGMGIAPELLPGVFEPFVQGRRTIERSQGGLGLGLALVRSLVQLHGGTVEAKSDGVGKGE
jgi:signal transduction histidine kinase